MRPIKHSQIFLVYIKVIDLNGNVIYYGVFRFMDISFITLFAPSLCLLKYDVSKWGVGGSSITDFCRQGGPEKDTKYAAILVEQLLMSLILIVCEIGNFCDMVCMKMSYTTFFAQSRFFSKSFKPSQN